MALKILPSDVRSMLCASASITNYKAAVEELVYNSLDAESTSIAIRINIQDNKIQVVDNGCGITKNDFNDLGKRYMTSKVPDVSFIKIIPKYYGYRGEFLPNIIEISQNMKITSRYKDGEETWAKIFYENKKIEITKTATRPSKGTTVEINGFLYNLNIQKHEIDPINDLQNIKSFLEQLCIIHTNISISLRDDSKNEIVFKIHKKRDIYQTLSILFEIEMTNIQELQVEKNQYKIKALIEKTSSKIERHLIYINGKSIKNGSNLHKVINEYFKKYLVIQNTKKSKAKNNHDEDHLFKKNIPFYFIFITCPYVDYDIISIKRQTVVEFKNWNQLKTMFEKLVKFYLGDIDLKEIKNPQKDYAMKQLNKKEYNHDKRNEVKKIINKIISKNLKTSTLQLQNGVKGKMIKRNHKNKVNNVCLQYPHANTKKIKNTSDRNKELRQEKGLTKNIKGSGPKETKLLSKKLIERKTVMPSYEQRNDNETFSLKKNSKKICNNMTSMRIFGPKQKLKTDKDNMIINKRRKFKHEKKKEPYNALQLLKEMEIASKKNNSKAKAATFMKQQNNCNKVVENNTNNLMNILKKKSFEKRSQSNTNRFRLNTDFLRHNIRIKPFKTTYDLVQTILNTQQISDDYDYHDIHSISNRKRKSISYEGLKRLIEPELPLNSLFTKYSNIEYSKKEIPNDNINSKDIVCCGLRCENCYPTSRYTKKDRSSIDTLVPKKPFAEHRSLRFEDIFWGNANTNYTQSDLSYNSSSNPIISALTYVSHNYNTNIFEDTRVEQLYKRQQTKKTHTMRFITRESRNNFTTANNRQKHHYKNNLEHIKETDLQMHYDALLKQVPDASYSIEYTKSNEYHSYHQSNVRTCYVQEKNTNYSFETNACHKDPILWFGNTYTISNHSSTLNNLNAHRNSQDICNSSKVLSSDLFVIEESSDIPCSPKETKKRDKQNINFICPSRTHSCEGDFISNEFIEPLNVCETVYLPNETIEKEFAYSFNRNSKVCESFYNNLDDIRHDVYDIDKYAAQIFEEPFENRDITSHHFSNNLTNKNSKPVDDETNINKSNMETNFAQIANGESSIKAFESNTREYNNDNKCTYIDKDDFDIKNRYRFIPKGMSQIFDKCNSKTACNYNLESDYYENIIYDDFANDVQMQTEIYEPVVQNAEDFTTKDINKVKNKINKQNTSLVFDEISLRDALVLNQVDCKFIASIMKQNFKDSEIASEYLVLFDQHAVHERIRLENNLADYCKEDRWMSVPLDNMTVSMSEDEMVYLHNYQDKFHLLGLRWSILNKSEILLNTIPEAVLGKNPREADKVIKAVKNLIQEEIKMIKLQRGCICLYPKTIMNLINSEACRYAIKFGDKLSKSDCIQLLRDLSNCKTPFQCAHGRPVMAVLVEIKRDMHDYKISPDSLKRFRLNRCKPNFGC